jgi:hypothetical protein
MVTGKLMVLRHAASFPLRSVASRRSDSSVSILVRMYFVNVGPDIASAHVIGTILDRVYDGRDAADPVLLRLRHDFGVMHVQNFDIA